MLQRLNSIGKFEKMGRNRIQTFSLNRTFFLGKIVLLVYIFQKDIYLYIRSAKFNGTKNVFSRQTKVIKQEMFLCFV